MIISRMSTRARPANARAPIGVWGARRERPRRTARTDALAGLAIAVIGIALAPGIAIVGIAALLLLVVCLGSIVVPRRLRRRR